MPRAITPRTVNYSQWYLDIVKEAQLADYGPTKGSIVIRPSGYALWERLQATLDCMLKEEGHVNAYFPLLIPSSYLQKEAEHVEGFAPETAVVTHGGGAALEEPLVIRPTSETVIWSMYKKWIQSYRDLPILINQWANVVRWEKRPRPFLRTTEFLWQEGHTAHSTAAEAQQEAQLVLEIYRRFVEEIMAIPVLVGQKSESERFAGAVETYAIEALMQDRKALQAGTSHFLGQNFAKAFDVLFQNEQGKEEFVWATSWGVSTRLIGALIMVHSDDRGLIIPPKCAPTEIVLIPIYKDSTRTKVLTHCAQLQHRLSKRFRIVIDADPQNSPGWKFAEWELRGVPLRMECGPKDIENNSVMVVRRDTGKKESVSLADLETTCSGRLSEMQHDLYQRALDFQKNHSQHFTNYRNFIQFLSEGGGLAYAGWDGSADTEQRVKEDSGATIRIIKTLHSSKVGHLNCIVSNQQAKYTAIFAKSY